MHVKVIPFIVHSVIITWNSYMRAIFVDTFSIDGGLAGIFRIVSMPAYLFQYMLYSVYKQRSSTWISLNSGSLNILCNMWLNFNFIGFYVVTANIFYFSLLCTCYSIPTNYWYHFENIVHFSLWWWCCCLFGSFLLATKLRHLVGTWDDVWLDAWLVCWFPR